MTMSVVPVVDQKGKKVADAQVPASLDNVKGDPSTVHQAVRAITAAQRAGTHSTKTRAEVRGGGAKPWRQKGTGRARHGSIRSPLWTGGGVTFGPQPRDHEMKLPKKMRRLALRQALSSRIQGDQVTVAKGFGVSEGRTKEGKTFLSHIKEEGKVLLVTETLTAEVLQAFGNLPQVKIVEPAEINVYDVLWADRLVFQEEAWKQLGEALG